MKNVININLPIFALLGCIFVTLKLCDVIDWSWWLVTLPFYAPLAVGLVILLGCGIVLGCLNLKK